MLTQVDMRYSADITAGSLKLPESRVVADLLLRSVGGADFHRAIVEQNVLQTRSPASAVRIGRLVQSRLALMGAGLWRLVRDGTGTVATHAVFAAAVKHSALLGDFLDLVVHEQYRGFATTLSKKLWDEYMQDCRGRDSEMPLWSESTRQKCGTVVYHILEQVGFIENTRSLKLQNVHMADPVIRYLKENDEQHVLRCVEVGP